MSFPNTNVVAGAAAVHESRSRYAAAPDDVSCRTKNVTVSATAEGAVPDDVSRRMMNVTVSATAAGAVRSGASRRTKNVTVSATAGAVRSGASRRRKNGMTNGTADANRRSPTKNVGQDATNVSCPDDLSAALRGLLSDVISRRSAFCGHRTAQFPRPPSWRRAPPD